MKPETFVASWRFWWQHCLRSFVLPGLSMAIAFPDVVVEVLKTFVHLAVPQSASQQFSKNNYLGKVPIRRAIYQWGSGRTGPHWHVRGTLGDGPRDSDPFLRLLPLTRPDPAGHVILRKPQSSSVGRLSPRTILLISF